MGTSARNLSLALAAALVAHLLILAMRFSAEPSYLATQRSITVNLSAVNDKDELAKDVTAEAAVEAPQPALKAREQTQPSIRAEDVIVASKPRVDSEPEIIIQSSLQSSAFKRFLKSETETSITNRNKGIEEERFNDTFLPPPRYQSPQELSPFTGNPVLAGNGVFATELKGKRTCYAEIMNLSDATVGSSFTSKDCTPPKKFKLNMKKPNNGWANR